MKFYFFLFLSLISYSSHSQIVGKIINSQSKEAIPFATISLIELKIATTSNLEGNFIFDIKPPSIFTISVNAVGFEPFLQNFIAEKDSIVIALHETHIELDGVEILGSRGGLQRDNITYIERKNIEDLNTIKSTNLGEAISNMSGVYNASVGNGISKPVIRGLSGTRIITMLNGTRIENQQWGSDHGMAVTSLGIGSVEVVKGPASLLYGSDALGGVVYFNDEDYAAHKTIETTFNSSFESNASNFQQQLGIKLSGSKLRMNAYVGWNSSADFKLPTGNYLNNSMYDDKMAKIALGFGNKNWISNLRYTYLTSTVGIPGETEDSIPNLNSYVIAKPERFAHTPYQQIQNHIATWENKFIIRRNILTALIGLNQNVLKEFEESTQESSLEMHLFSLPYTVKYDWAITRYLNLSSGIQGMYQQNRNALHAEERLIPNANTFDNGLFTMLTWNKNKTKYQAGLRGDLRSIQVLDDSIQFNQQFPSINFSAGIIHQFSKSQQIRLNFASGFRSPHTSELLANGSHEGALRYEIGSTSLQNEQAFQLDFTYELSGKHLSFIVNPFYNHMKNYITLGKTDSIIDGLPVYQYTQLENSYFFGTDLGLHIHPHFAHWLHLETSYSYIRGQQKSGTSLPLIPAARILNTVRLDLNKGKLVKWKSVSAQLNYFFKQTHFGENEQTIWDYALINVATTCSFKNWIEFSVGVKNIMNKQYFNNLSPLRNIGIPQNGRNIYIQLIFKLQQNIK